MWSTISSLFILLSEKSVESRFEEMLTMSHNDRWGDEVHLASFGSCFSEDIQFRWSAFVAPHNVGSLSLLIFEEFEGWGVWLILQWQSPGMTRSWVHGDVVRNYNWQWMKWMTTASDGYSDHPTSFLLNVLAKRTALSGSVTYDCGHWQSWPTNPSRDSRVCWELGNLVIGIYRLASTKCQK